MINHLLLLLIIISRRRKKKHQQKDIFKFNVRKVKMTCANRLSQYRSFGNGRDKEEKDRHNKLCRINKMITCNYDKMIRTRKAQIKMKVKHFSQFIRLLREFSINLT